MADVPEGLAGKTDLELCLLFLAENEGTVRFRAERLSPVDGPVTTVDVEVRRDGLRHSHREAYLLDTFKGAHNKGAVLAGAVKDSTRKLLNHLGWGHADPVVKEPTVERTE